MKQPNYPEVFKSLTEYTIYQWIIAGSMNYCDESTSGLREFGEKVGLPEELVEWAEEMEFTLSALEAGIPLSVITGKTKLTSHFSQDEINRNIGVGK